MFSHRASFTTSELYAILMAVGFIFQQEPPKMWVLCTDSQVALLFIHSFNSRNAYFVLVNTILQYLITAAELGEVIALQRVSEIP